MIKVTTRIVLLYNLVISYHTIVHKVISPHLVIFKIPSVVVDAILAIV